MMERTHDVAPCDPASFELETWIDAARRGDRDALGQALTSVRVSFEDIGLRCGISAEAARKLWTRALGRLRKELGPTHDSR